MLDRALYATAFGRFDQPRGWVGHQLDGTGILFRLDTGEDVLTGLCCPHTPRLEPNGWIVCNSASSDLRLFGASGELIKRAQLRDWVRGLAVTDDYVLVGESVNRQLTDDLRGATVAILDRQTWTVLGRLELPYREVYDLILVSSDLLEGIIRAPNARLIAPHPPQIPISPT
jgi:acetolactate synthase-1/2/3 large subunit